MASAALLPACPMGMRTACHACQGTWDTVRPKQPPLPVLLPSLALIRLCQFGFLLLELSVGCARAAASRGGCAALPCAFLCSLNERRALFWEPLDSFCAQTSPCTSVSTEGSPREETLQRGWLLCAPQSREMLPALITTPPNASEPAGVRRELCLCQVLSGAARLVSVWVC